MLRIIGGDLPPDAEWELKLNESYNRRRQMSHLVNYVTQSKVRFETDESIVKRLLLTGIEPGTSRMPSES